MLIKNMDYVLTFVASDLTNHPLEEDFLSLLEYKKIPAEQHHWLCERRALDVIIPDVLSLEKMQDLRIALETMQIDVFCTPQNGRRKKLLVADMDSTIVVGETLDELSSFAGVKPQVEEITRRAMNGEIAFDDALRERVGLLKNLHEGALAETLSAIQIMPGAKMLVQAMKKKGVICVLVTGGFTYFADEIGEEAGFDYVHGNQLELQDGYLSGKVIPPILDKDSKLSYLQHYAADLGFSMKECCAIGDGANDLPMLEAAGLGIGYHPKDVLKERLLNIILHGDLRAVLYAQGYQGFE